MKVIRRIFGNLDTKDNKDFIEKIFNTSFEWGYFIKDVDEKSQEYKQVREVITKNGWHDSVIGTEFSKQEVYNAEILYFVGARAFSYPEPQSPSFLESTYFDSCKECGIYGEQKADFAIKKQPILGSGGLGTLHWVYDELFSTYEVYKNYFEGLNMDFRPVKLMNKKVSAENIVQLIIPLHNTSLEMARFESSSCEVCGRIKYSPSIHGFFPLPKGNSFHITKTNEFFGSGHSASHRILVSNEMMQQMIQHKMAKYHQFVPCKAE
ncbi:hypothetical protein FAZ19_18410 [Sphingobacterium alkalisoli]|uniref:Uncharacterized protein n=1 Tax=Sphingobacterium alkalisoli TaxID=1874115 RepID=A0A4U0GWN9_9SPHI|nr:hypothetical protein [Sphingobacterium alkalisoli]TJY63551.1 hypothetical protein FAZ19_18410 [Sphingobacterium alkalisoli]